MVLIFLHIILSSFLGEAPQEITAHSIESYHCVVMEGCHDHHNDTIIPLVRTFYQALPSQRTGEGNNFVGFGYVISANDDFEISRLSKNSEFVEPHFNSDKIFIDNHQLRI